LSTGINARKKIRSCLGRARARYRRLSRNPPREGLAPNPVPMMQAIGAPLREIPEVAATL
jgi:hypothetical protein